eukprot:1618425-Karenia_brevis.AAC.1
MAILMPTCYVRDVPASIEKELDTLVEEVDSAQTRRSIGVSTDEEFIQYKVYSISGDLVVSGQSSSDKP